MAYEKAIAEVRRELDNAIKTRKRHRDSVLAKVFAEPRTEIGALSGIPKTIIRSR